MDNSREKNKMMGDALRIELVPWSQLKQEEVQHLQQIFISEGLAMNVSSSVYLRKAVGIPPIIQVLILVPFFWFSQGFFTEMGRDSWEALKRGIKKAHRYLREKYHQDPDKELCFRQEDQRIIVSLPREDDKQLSEALDKLPEYLETWSGEKSWIVYDEVTHEWHQLGCQ